MDRTPHDSRRRASQPGDGPIFTPSITRAAYRAHRSGASIRIFTASPAGGPASASPGAGARTWVPSAAATSRAMPMCESASGRFGVTFTSRSTSSSASAFAMGVPGATVRSRISRPLASSESPSSFAEQSMPEDSTPRSFAFSIFVPPGRTVPTVASGTTSPTW